ncbi:hypothetical protein ACVWZ8_000148 [Arthrobacter sp. UYCu723]
MWHTAISPDPEMPVILFRRPRDLEAWLEQLAVAAGRAGSLRTPDDGTCLRRVADGPPEADAG